MESTNLKVIPYVEVDGVWTFRDSEIKNIYDTMVQDGTAEAVFCDGSVHNRDEFQWCMKRGDSTLYVAQLDNGAVVGIGWLNRFQYHFCQGHFCFMKKFWKNPILITAARMMIRTMFKTQDVNMMLGILPYANRHALPFIEKSGADLIGTLPYGSWNQKEQKSEDAILFQFTRDKHENLQ
jgi:hypothetical protein